MAAVPDERAVWIHQHLRIRSSQNLVDLDPDHLDVVRTENVEGGGGSDIAAELPHAAREWAAGSAAARAGARTRRRKKAARKVRVKAFDIRVEEYKEERRQVNEKQASRESSMRCPRRLQQSKRNARGSKQSDVRL